MKPTILPILLLSCACAGGQEGGTNYGPNPKGIVLIADGKFDPTYVSLVTKGQTNVTVPLDYKGTIQVGDKFYKVCQVTNVVKIEHDHTIVYVATIPSVTDSITNWTYISTNITTELKEIK